MAELATIGTYGGIKEDAAPVENVKSQVAASEWNRKAEDTAQMTRTSPKVIVSFPTDAAGGTPFAIAEANVTVRAQWGTGDSAKPVVTKTSDPGRYTLTFETEYADALGNDETLGFFEARAWARSSTPLEDIDVEVLTVTANTVTIATSNAGALADIGGASAAVFQVIVEIW
jgi:hypothetical protein